MFRTALSLYIVIANIVNILNHVTYKAFFNPYTSACLGNLSRFDVSKSKHNIRTVTIVSSVSVDKIGILNMDDHANTFIGVLAD